MPATPLIEAQQAGFSLGDVMDSVTVSITEDGKEVCVVLDVSGENRLEMAGYLRDVAHELEDPLSESTTERMH